MRYLLIVLCLLVLALAPVSKLVAAAPVVAQHNAALIADNPIPAPSPMLDGIDWDEWLMLDGIDWDEWLMSMFGIPPGTIPCPIVRPPVAPPLVPPVDPPVPVNQAEA